MRNVELTSTSVTQLLAYVPQNTSTNDDVTFFVGSAVFQLDISTLVYSDYCEPPGQQRFGRPSQR